MDALLPKIGAEVQKMIPAVVKETIAQMNKGEEAEVTDSEEADDGSDSASDDDEDIPELINQPRRQRLQIENTSAPPPAQRTRRPRYPRLPGPTPEQLQQNQETVFIPIQGTPRNAKVSDKELLRRRRAASLKQRLAETKAGNNADVAVSVTPWKEDLEKSIEYVGAQPGYGAEGKGLPKRSGDEEVEEAAEKLGEVGLEDVEK
jgi:hypothetical protein